MPKNYYLILGIGSDATPDDIKMAYRRLAKEFHPDRYGENHSPFLDIQEAYSVLSDPCKRRSHDLAVQEKKNKRIRPSKPLHVSPHRFVEPLVPEREPVFSPSRYQAPGSADGLSIRVTLPLIQAMSGGRIRVLIPAEHMCRVCSGSGRTGPYGCRECSGRGTIQADHPVMIYYPPNMQNDHRVRIPLDAHGLTNQYLTVRFRIADMPP